jgi:hypothetical protein
MQQRGGYVIRTSGLHARVRLNNPHGARVQTLEIGGAPYAAQRRYTVAGAGTQDIRTEDRQPTGVHALDALRRYLAACVPVQAEVTGARFVAV